MGCSAGADLSATRYFLWVRSNVYRVGLGWLYFPRLVSVDRQNLK